MTTRRRRRPPIAVVALLLLLLTAGLFASPGVEHTATATAGATADDRAETSAPESAAVRRPVQRPRPVLVTVRAGRHVVPEPAMPAAPLTDPSPPLVLRV
ncbi:hypothetical protein AB0F72_20080 [Actinoplanes sp. NPDC023936]|uniref:hypothetical protein n=1 Tax=Actinoplanes sp. NPDC023936 TaxID=3154910 RepID=UPI0033DAE69A